MNYHEIRMLLPSATAEILSDALMENGALSSAIEDAHAGTEEEQAIFGEPGEQSEIWERSLVLALFENAQSAQNGLQAACAALNIPVPPVQTAEIPEQDWVRLTQAQFDPIRICARLWIVPSWHDAPDSSAVNLKLDPGLAFGTGSHPTTRLCLQWLDKNLRGGEKILDYGCGSGILAIAAAKLGATHADGIDIDPQAVQASRDNAAANQVSADVNFYTPDNAPAAAQQYDIVLANILANPLRLLGGMLAAYTRTGGKIILSGILAHQAEEICTLYSQWFDMEKPQEDEGWAGLSGTRKA